MAVSMIKYLFMVIQILMCKSCVIRLDLVGAGVGVALGPAADQAACVQLLNVIGEEGDVGREAHGQAGGKFALMKCNNN